MFGMIFLPLLLFFFKRGLESAEPLFSPWTHAAGAALACSLLAGHHQPFVHSCLGLAVFCLIVTARNGWKKNLRTLATVGIGSLLFASPQILLSLEYFGKAYRWTSQKMPALAQVPYQEYAYQNALNPQFLLYFAWSWMPAAAGFATVILLTDHPGPRKRLAAFGLVLGVFSLLSSLGGASLIGGLTWYVPLINTVRETERFIFPFLFALSLLLGLSVDWLAERMDGALPKTNLGKPTGAWSFSGLLLKSALFSLTGLAVWMHSAPFLYVQPAEDPFSPSLLYPQEPVPESRGREGAIAELLELYRTEQGKCRVLNYQDTLAPNLGNVYGIPTTLGHRATMFAPYFDFLEGHLGNPLSSRFDELGACYLVSDKRFDLPVVFDGGNVLVYRRPGAHSVFQLHDSQTGRVYPVPISGIDWYQNRVDLRLSQAVSGRLVFSQLSYPGWEVRVNDQARPLRPLNTFLACDVGREDRTVSFVYRPLAWRWGLTAAGLAFTALLITCLAVFPKRLALRSLSRWGRP